MTSAGLGLFSLLASLRIQVPVRVLRLISSLACVCFGEGCPGCDGGFLGSRWDLNLRPSGLQGRLFGEFVL